MMDLDLQWLLLGLPVAFALGWMASRFDLRQLKRERDESPSAYYKGLNLLLNEQQDAAIDAFIEAVQNDPNTAELHFALGNLFRRRGEFERAVRVHEHLLGRADLKAADRDRAQLALAQDFMKAGLFDRAETAWRALQGTAFEHDAQLALLSLYERSRDWPQAAAVARRLAVLPAGSKASTGVGSAAVAPVPGSGSLAARIAHYECEMAEAFDAQGDRAQGDAALQRAQAALENAELQGPATAKAAATAAATSTVRPLVLAGQRQRRAGLHEDALQAWDHLRAAHPAAFVLVAQDYADSALHCSPDVQAKARRALDEALASFPSVDLLRAVNQLRAAAGDAATLGNVNSPPNPAPTDAPAGGFSQAPAGASPYQAQLLHHLQQHPSLSAAQLLLDLPPAQWTADTSRALRSAVARAAKPLQRYRCGVCGFEAQHYFWQCPGCLSWDSYPPQRLDAS